MILNFRLIKEILEYEKEIGVELIVNERSPTLISFDKYYVRFEGSSVRDGDTITNVQGSGNTVDEALINYAKLIQCRILVIDHTSKKRREILCPELTHTKKLNL